MENSPAAKWTTLSAKHNREFIQASGARAKFVRVQQHMNSNLKRHRIRLPFLWARRKVNFFSTFTCPKCNRRSRDQMPTNASVYFYGCAKCGTIIRPLPGRCCVYCSYGDHPCPTKQREGWL